MISRFGLDLTEPDWALATSGTSSCAAAAPPCSRPRRTGHDRPADAVADGRALPGHRAALAGRPVRGAGGHAGRDHHHRRDLGRGGASRSPTRWSRPGRPTRTAASITPTTRAAAAAGRALVPRLRPLPDRPRRVVPHRHAQAGPAAQPGRRHRGAAHRRVGVRPRPARPAGDADLFPRRAGGERGRPGAAGRRGPRPPGHADRRGAARAPAARAGSGSTSTCRATRRPSSSMYERPPAGEEHPRAASCAEHPPDGSRGRRRPGRRGRGDGARGAGPDRAAPLRHAPDLPSRPRRRQRADLRGRSRRQLDDPRCGRAGAARRPARGHPDQPVR